MAHQKKTEVIDVKLFKSYQAYQAVLQERAARFSILCFHMCCLKKTSRKSKIFHPWMQSFANSTQVWICSHLLNKAKDTFRQFSPINGSQNEEWAKLVCLPPTTSILYGYFIYSWIEYLSCGTGKSLLLCCRWAIPEILQQQYNDFFFMCRNDCFSEAFKHLLPFLSVTFTRDLEKLL